MSTAHTERVGIKLITSIALLFRAVIEIILD